MISTGLRQAAILFAAWHLAATAFAWQFPVERPGTLKVALVSGSHSPAYLTDQTLAALKDYLEENYPMTCLLLTTNQADNGFINIESLDEADTAVFFVRRKTPDEQNMAVLRRFFDSGKGFVALRPTSHAWENWTSFDTDVLGAKYEGTFDGRNPMQFVHAHPHPIFTGVGGFQTRQYMYQYGALADDVHVIMQGRNASGTTPLAWTREHKGGRVFHLVPSHVDDFANPDYLRIIAHGILWVTRQEVPGAETAVVRGITNKNGRYRFTRLPAGEYHLAVTLSGFRDSPRAPVGIAAGAPVIRDFELSPRHVTAAHRIETIPLHQQMSPEISGLDFTPAGRIVVCNRLGEVWIGDLSDGSWRRFAHGLYEPFGLVATSKRVIHVLQRPEITVLSDTNGDGVADLYETLNDAWGILAKPFAAGAKPMKDSSAWSGRERLRWKSAPWN